MTRKPSRTRAGRISRRNSSRAPCPHPVRLMLVGDICLRRSFAAWKRGVALSGQRGWEQCRRPLRWGRPAIGLAFCHARAFAVASAGSGGRSGLARNGLAAAVFQAQWKGLCWLGPAAVTRLRPQDISRPRPPGWRAHNTLKLFASFGAGDAIRTRDPNLGNATEAVSPDFAD